MGDFYYFLTVTGACILLFFYMYYILKYFGHLFSNLLEDKLKRISEAMFLRANIGESLHFSNDGKNWHVRNLMRYCHHTHADKIGDFLTFDEDGHEKFYKFCFEYQYNTSEIPEWWENPVSYSEFGYEEK